MLDKIAASADPARHLRGRTRLTNVALPTLHPGQVRAHDLKARFRAVRCGRRWGKTALGTTWASDYAVKGRYVGWFAPEYKFIAEAYRDLEVILDPVKRSASRDGVYSVRGGGRIDFWSLENELAGRSRKYHLVIVDEGAFTKDTMLDTWRKNIRPTLLDYGGVAAVLSNTNGIDPANFLYQICHEKSHGFVDFHAPTRDNPHLPAEEVARLKKDNHPLVYQQEYEAEFVDWSGDAFFSRDSLLVRGSPVEVPAKCDAVFAVIDSATKTGKANDGTAVTYFAMDKTGRGHPLVVLDWDLIQIEGALLETWLPTVFSTLEDFARKCGARAGSLGTFIEDKDSGQILLQQALRRRLNAHAIESTLTAVGKDERAISVSGYVYRGEVKMAVPAFERTSTFKETTRNHLLGQVTGFRPGDKEAAKRADDLLDTFTYGVAIALGNAEGH